MSHKEWDKHIKQERENQNETSEWEDEKRYQQPEDKGETDEWEKEKQKDRE